MTVVATVLIALLGVVGVVAGALVFVVTSMARATYALLASFVAVGLVLVVLGLDYLGPITILMMGMEMAIMGLFMIMFMGMNPALMQMDMTHTGAKRPVLAVSVAVFAALSAAILLIPWPAQAHAPAGDRTAALGTALMESKMLVMLTVSPTLLATIVVAVVLANPRGRYDRFGDRLRRPVPDDPEAGGIGR